MRYEPAVLALLVFGCGGGGGSSEGSSGAGGVSADLASVCGTGWVEACEAVSCDPQSELWRDCRMNGWEGFQAPTACAVSSGFDGDDVALCPPVPEDGFQIRFGPDDYDDPASLEPYVMPPGGESIECAYVELPNGSEHFLQQLVGRARPGMHHGSIKLVSNPPSSLPEACNPIVGELLHIGQNPSFQVPDLSTPNPDPGGEGTGGLDLEGGAIRMPPGRTVAIELHYFNTTTEPLLREAWLNFYTREPSEVSAVLTPISLLGLGIMVPPRSTGTVVRRACEAPSPRYVTHLQGHTHENTQRFTIWKHEAATDQLTQLYESYDPLEPALLTYSDLIENIPADPASKRPGGTSGRIRLEAGDSLVWECEIDNPSADPVMDGGPAQGQQMCYTFGNFIADGDAPEGNWGCLVSEEPGF